MLEDFLTPLSKSITTKIASLSTNQWGRQLHVYTPANKEMLLELGDNNIQLAIVGVQEDRQNSGCAMAGEAIRHELYQLYNWHPSFKVADLGNIKSGNTQKDTYFAIKNVVANLIEQKIVPIIVGGTHDVSYGQFLGHCEGNKSINVVFFDEKIDLFHTNEGEKRQDYLYKMLTRQLGLLHFTHVGYQRYLIAPSMLDTLEKLHFECYSLGNIRANMREVEPIVRNAHMLSFDVAAIRQSDFPATNQASPHGFLGEEACQIARYAGLSNHVQSFGIYECNPTLDRAQQSVQVAAQMIWYFVDGFYGRTYDLPEQTWNEQDFLAYIVSMKEQEHNLVFVKSKKSDRWWMKIDVFQAKTKQETTYLVPCSYADYQLACRGEIPDRWLASYFRLSTLGAEE